MEYIIVLGNSNPKVVKTRVDTAINYFKQKPYKVYNNWTQETTTTRILLFTGGYSNTLKAIESEYMRDYAISKGVDPDSILCERSSRNTIENLQNCKDIIDSRNSVERVYNDTVTIVTSSFHAKRSFVLAKIIIQQNCPGKARLGGGEEGQYVVNGVVHTNEIVTQEEEMREINILNNFLTNYLSIELSGYFNIRNN
jgi:uncharacterized SAM-binding protein YcdF (DUF218 family)